MKVNAIAADNNAAVCFFAQCGLEKLLYFPSHGRVSRVR